MVDDPADGDIAIAYRFVKVIHIAKFDAPR